MLQLVKNQSGVYEYKEVGATPSSSLRSTDFEAYEGTQKTTLAESTDLGSQTKSLMREAPGQMEVVTDAQTGETKTVNKGSSQVAVQQREFKNITPTSNENALDKIARITAANPQGTDSSQDLNRVYNLIERQQKLKEQAQQFDQLYKGADLAFRAYDTFTDFKKAGRLNIVPMKGGSTLNPLSGFMGTNVGQSTVGGVGTAGMAGYGVSKILGGDKKQNRGAGVGSAIGMAVGGPVGGVVGGVIGAVFGGGGTVICTELYKQNLMSKENHRLSWNFTINNFSDTHINGYWYWAIPMVKVMKKSKLITKFWNHVMSNRTKDIKWRLKKGKFNLLGRLYSMLIENGSYVVGKLIKNKKTKEVLA